MYGDIDFSVLQGLVLQEIRYLKDVDGNEVLYFVTSEGCFEMYHCQDCCESVSIEDVTGDPLDLKGAYVTLAEAATNEASGALESGTWTFYKLSTPKGDLTIRWLGESNGYYSEGVSFYRRTGSAPASAKEWVPGQ